MVPNTRRANDAAPADMQEKEARPPARPPVCLRTPAPTYPGGASPSERSSRVSGVAWEEVQKLRAFTSGNQDGVTHGVEVIAGGTGTVL